MPAYGQDIAAEPTVEQATPAPEQGPVPTPSTPAPAKKGMKTGTIILIVVACILAVIIIGVAILVHKIKKAVDEYDLKPDDLEYETSTDVDIDMDELQKEIDALKDLDINTDISVDVPGIDVPKPDEEDQSSDNAPAGDKTVYSYIDVYRDGNNLTLVPNGGMNASTVLAGGKDLGGFLDYVDDVVLEKGRTINREFFYNELACMLGDESMTSDFDKVEKNMMMALAVANNFHDTPVVIKDCYFEANNDVDYHYHVVAYDKDDTWLINYVDKTVFFNDGKTEYHSTMFKDEYLAVWLVAIEEYYLK